ncbi:MAG: NADH-quinone oxidoreductase subunit M [Vulcanococcus sp.]|jgi:NAD(P)H-quinone oxidoreductase subunit 4|uniref:NADH-quinone oxidoreductase subunit M n=1 Tax=Vulcanococcus sp. TaxID=2856995 RepID=UPI0025D04D1F|nr:NADH-quinone oxidoreductase subunit M [Vulcanococcus sp.]MBW0173258.1 NADH-quinone oxidoreductase subunit M [Vulcanococcus sp.]MBW0181122.1 NADH-quinone oxidoreductase subunit M [Vulcanococcus sp.]
MLLSSLLLIPFLGCLALLVWPGSPTPGRLRQITIVMLVAQLILSLVTAAQFDPMAPGLQLQEHHSWVPGIGLDYALGVDGLSLPLVLINGALTLVSAVITRDISKRPRLYFAMLLLISGAVNGAFLADNLLLFFLFYELELIPLWLLISVWGGVNRAYAATKFLIFTAVSGMLILGAFLGLALLTGTVDFSLTPVLSERLAMGGQLWLLGAILIGFGIKIPLVPLHNWLPDAHTQASTPVSVLLAGVLLKLGTYGLLRFGLQLFPEAWARLAPALAIWAAVSVLYGSLAAIAQTDMKRMVAYSSVGHMGYVLLAAAANTPVSLLGAVFQMVSHGLISALLFLLVGIVYRKTGTRDLEVLRGLLNPERGLPLTGSLMIVAVMASAGLPGMAGFISEFLVFRGSITAFPLATLLSMVGSGLTAVYFLLLVNRAFFGRLAITPPSGDATSDARLDVQLNSVAPRETIPALALAASIVFIGLVPSSLGNLSEVASTALANLTAGVG